MCTKCKKQLVSERGDGTTGNFGENAHIQGEKKGAARYNPEMTDIQRNDYQNLILLCPTCHTEIDKTNPQLYSADQLLTIKKAHEELIQREVLSKISFVTFSELDVVIKYLKDKQGIGNEDLTLVTPKEKILKNGLSVEAESYIQMGMAKVRLVDQYLNQYVDENFSDRLRNGFVNKYNELKEDGLNGNEIFYIMLDFAWHHEVELLKKAAGLAVLVYYFERCEILEK